MKCPECGKENPQGAKFCIKCGKGLALPCPKCRTSNPPEASYCGKCGTGLSSDQPECAKSARARYLLTAGAMVLLLGIATVGIWFLGSQVGWWTRPERTPVVEHASPESSPAAEDNERPQVERTDMELEPNPILSVETPEVERTATGISATLPPPLIQVEFPDQAQPYPDNWPGVLHYPEVFSLVETTSGLLTDGAKGWGAKLLYEGEAEDAADLLASFFVDRGWQVVERTELDTGGLLLLVQQEGKENGGALILDPDPNDPNIIRVLITILP